MSSFEGGGGGGASINSSTFTCVLIPESDFEPLKTLTLSTAGGLEKVIWWYFVYCNIYYLLFTIYLLKCRAYFPHEYDVF